MAEPDEQPDGAEPEPGDEGRDEDVRDELPADLDAAGFVGPYRFPDNDRRRIPGVLYLAIATGCFALWAFTRNDDPVLVNQGFFWVAVFLAAVGVYSIAAGVRLEVDDKSALVAATKAVGFPVGHASAQLGWRGLMSRPTWRILLYSSEDPPRKRGLVLVDGADGRIVDQLVEDNPEDWSQST